MGRGTSVVFGVLRRVTGVDLLQDLGVFFRALGGLIDGFRERATGVKTLLADPATTFLIVTSPEREPVEEAIFFRGKLREAGMPFGGLDRQPRAARPRRGRPRRGGRGARRRRWPTSSRAKVAETLRELQVLADARPRARSSASWTSSTSADPIVVPLLEGDVHDVDGLAQVHHHLFFAEDERRLGGGSSSASAADAQVAVQVAAQRVAEQRAQVLGELVDDVARRRPPAARGRRRSRARA